MLPYHGAFHAPSVLNYRVCSHDVTAAMLEE